MAPHHFARLRTAADAPPPPGPGLTRRQMLMGSLAAVGGVAAASALAGCAPTASASGLSQLAYWHLLSGGDGITMAGLVDKVNALDHGYEATQTVLAWGAPYYTKLAMASVGGRSPDVAIMHASRVAGYAPGGLLDPWDLDLLAEFGVRESDFLERVWAKGGLDGKQYSIALDSHPFVMMYNLDIAEQADVLGPDGQLAQRGISPEDAERLLLRPVETQLKSVANVKEMRSTAFEGGGYVLLEFEAGFDFEVRARGRARQGRRRQERPAEGRRRADRPGGEPLALPGAGGRALGRRAGAEPAAHRAVGQERDRAGAGRARRRNCAARATRWWRSSPSRC